MNLYLKFYVFEGVGLIEAPDNTNLMCDIYSPKTEPSGTAIVSFLFTPLMIFCCKLKIYNEYFLNNCEQKGMSGTSSGSRP